MRHGGFPVMHTRALGHAFVFPTANVRAPVAARLRGYAALSNVEAPAPEASAAPAPAPMNPETAAAHAALEEAKRLYMTIKARLEDLTAMVGRLKADEALGQAASAVENAKAAYRDAMAKGA